MRSLFLTIFLGFWLAVLIAAGVGGAITAASDERVAVPSRFYDIAGPGYLESAHASLEQYDLHGEPALEAYLTGLKQGSQLSGYLLDAQGVDLTHRAVPAAVMQAARTSECGRRSGLAVDHGRLLRWTTVTDTQARSYLFIGGVDLPAVHLFPVLRVIVLLSLVTAACYGLTRYITAPILILRSAAKRLAQGEFDARVGLRMGGRKDELATLGQDFDTMAVRLQTLMEAQQRLLGDVSHELRSPLARLNVALALARRDESPQIRPSLDRIEREGIRLNEMIGQLLTLSRLEGDSQLRRDRIEVTDLLQSVVSDVEYEANGRREAVVFSVATRQHLVSGDISLLRSAIENIVRNAVLHTAQGDKIQISVETDIGGESVVISVSDHGPGVPEEHLEQIFHPFFRVDTSRARVSGGAGLGLAIASRAIRMHDGSISAANSPAGGLIVTVRLPAVR